MPNYSRIVRMNHYRHWESRCVFGDPAKFSRRIGTKMDIFQSLEDPSHAAHIAN